MAKKLIICVHGIGNFSEGYHHDWADILNANHDSEKFLVQGLLWDDLQDQLYDKYLQLPDEISHLLDDTFLKNIKACLTDPENADTVDFLKENIVDVFNYLFFHEFRKAILWPEISLRLLHLIQQYPNHDPILLGHSLGSVLLAHLVWLLRAQGDFIKFYDFFLLGSPIGLKSPIPAIKDFIDLLMEIGSHDSREETLQIFAGEWWHPNRNKLHIISNEFDPVAWDVRMDVGLPEPVDVIPVRQCFSEEEIDLIHAQNPETLITFQEGSNAPEDLIANHDIIRYLQNDRFQQTFDAVL